MASLTGVIIGFKGKKSQIQKLIKHMIENSNSYNDLLECNSAELELPCGITEEFSELNENAKTHLVLCGINCENVIKELFETVPELECFAETHYSGYITEESALSEIFYSPANSKEIKSDYFIYNDFVCEKCENYKLDDNDADQIGAYSISYEENRQKYLTLFGKDSDYLYEIINPDGDYADIEKAIDFVKIT